MQFEAVRIILVDFTVSLGQFAQIVQIERALVIDTLPDIELLSRLYVDQTMPTEWAEEVDLNAWLGEGKRLWQTFQRY